MGLTRDDLSIAARGVWSFFSDPANMVRMVGDNPDQDKYCKLQFARMLELYYSYVIVSEFGIKSASDIITRSLFESYADVATVLGNVDGYKYILSDYYYEMLRNVSALIKMDGIDADVMGGVVGACKRRYESIKSEGFERRTQSRKFKIAEIDPRVSHANCLLSLATHGNLASVGPGHTELDGDVENYVVFKELDADHLFLPFYVSTGALLDAAKMIWLYYAGTDEALIGVSSVFLDIVNMREQESDHAVYKGLLKA